MINYWQSEIDAAKGTWYIPRGSITSQSWDKHAANNNLLAFTI